MRLKRHKTWSQQELAVKLRVQPEANGGFAELGAQAATHSRGKKTALAAAFCWWLAQRFGMPDGYWGPISAIIVLQSNVGSTVTASRERLLGTLIGAALGFSFSLMGPLLLSYILAVLTAVIVCGMLGLRNSSRLAGVTITIVMLVHKEGSHWGLAITRVSEVLLGIVVALAVTTLVFPDRARLRLREGLGQEFLLLGAFFEAILEGFRGVSAKNLAALRDELQTLQIRNGQLLEASRYEPSGGPGWREGLSMLAQFSHSLYDVLLALDLSVQGSREDGFAQQLDPALGKLAADIHTGFIYVAGCIHKWRFDTAPQGVNLEQDIVDLEASMDKVRHTGIGFSQAEILRAYAVQLHLKQIARLLRASRVETNLAVRQTPE